MKTEEVKALAEEALLLTPGKAASVSLVLEQQPGKWVILIQESGEELAIRFDESEHASLQAVRRELIAQIRSLV